MLNVKKVSFFVLGASVLLAGPAYVQNKSAPAGKLTTQDYIDIQQLVEGYPYRIDNCTNSGYDYADQYVADGVFGVSSEWNSPSATHIWYRGREELADAGGGGKGGCRAK